MLCIEDNIHLFTLVKFVMYTIGMVVGTVILIRQLATGQMTTKMGVSCILFEETVFKCSLGFATALQLSSKVKAIRIKGYNQITWLKICLTNKYYMKTDFLWEKVFIACALVKNKVGKMCLFLQATSRLCELSKIIRVSSFHPTCKCTCTILKYLSNTGNCIIVDLSFFSSCHQDQTNISCQPGYCTKWVYTCLKLPVIGTALK